MTKEEYERRRAAGWDDTKAPADYLWGKVLFFVVMAFLSVVGVATFLKFIWLDRQ